MGLQRGIRDALQNIDGETSLMTPTWRTEYEVEGCTGSVGVRNVGNCLVQNRVTWRMLVLRMLNVRVLLRPRDVLFAYNNRIFPS